MKFAKTFYISTFNEVNGCFHFLERSLRNTSADTITEITSSTDQRLMQRRTDLEKKCLIALALTIFSCSLMTPALSISVSFSAENGGKIVSSSSTYSLDRSTSLQESATLGDGKISKDLTASGSGDNRISISSSANGKNAGTEIESSGDFRTAAFAGASNDGVLISQDTAMSGSYGGITYHADSPENIMVVSTGFEGEGDLTAGVTAAAGENAAISGNVNALGVEILNDESMQIIGSGDISMSVDGLSNGGSGSFGLGAANTRKGKVGSDTSALLTGPATTATGGRSSAYTLLGYRWNTKDPQLKWALKDDAYITGEGLSASNVKRAIEAASNTWDAGTNQNLFADTNLVTPSSTVKVDTYDGKNTVAWKPFGAGALAYARTWYRGTKVDGYYSALESDINMNTAYSWSTTGSGSKIDVQSVVLHEMGHSIGLGDLYGKAQFANDKRQVMHYYTGVKRTLGNGDATGVWTLYK
jgi:hypothetical protein